MNKKIILITVIIAMIISSFFIGKSIGNEAPQDVPDQCYSMLEPTRIGSTPGISLNDNKVSLTFYNEYEIDTRQSAGTGSMRPALGRASILITAENPKSKDLYVGDIIIFDCNGKSIVHRIIDINEGKYLTKGDNNRNNDEESFNCVPEIDDIKSKVMGVVY